MNEKIKSFSEIINETSIFEDVDISYLNEEQLEQCKSVFASLNESYKEEGIKGVEKKLEEGFLGTLAGFIIGPSIGKIIANALGVEKGILYDMLTSRLVSAALGNAIQNNAKK